jgi:DNA polymerase III subunit delta
MKLTYFQLEQQLTKKLSSVYIISGEEWLLKQDALDLIRKTATQAGFSERIRITPEAGYDFGELYTLLYATSLLAEKRILELDFRDMAPNKIANNILNNILGIYGEKPVPTNLLLIDIGKMDDKIIKSAWYQSLEKIGMVVTIWPIPREQLPQWIIQRAKKYKLQMNRDAANLLTDYTEGNLVAAAQAIEKIYLLQPQKAIDSELMTLILTDESRFTVFDFIEHVISGNPSRALHILANLKAEGTEPVLILWSVTRELRLLSDMAQQLKQGITHEKLFQKHRIFARRQSAIRRFLSRHSAEDCWHALTYAAEIDRIIKGAAPGNVWDSLQLFCLKTGIIKRE